MKLYFLPALVILAGLFMIGRGMQYPRYSDPRAMDRFLNVDPVHQDIKELTREFYSTQHKYQTARIALLDWGIGFIGLGFSVLMSLALLRVRRLRDLVQLHTPASPRSWLVLINLAWTIPIATFGIYFSYTLRRGDYPWYSDAVAIPYFGTVVICLFLALFLNTCLPLLLRGATLPVSLWFTQGISAHSFVWTAVSALVCAFSLFLIIVDGFAGNGFTIPAYVVWVYLALSMRSIILSRKRSNPPLNPTVAKNAPAG